MMSDVMIVIIVMSDVMSDVKTVMNHESVIWEQ